MNWKSNKVETNVYTKRPPSLHKKSLQTGHFSEGWKEALVYPLLKKPGHDAVNKNFRPVSIRVEAHGKGMI